MAEQKMTIENAKYEQRGEPPQNKAVIATIDGVDSSVPMDTDNRHYAEILKQVADGDITIQEAD
jgi:hypothetical protein